MVIIISYGSKDLLVSIFIFLTWVNTFKEPHPSDTQTVAMVTVHLTKVTLVDITFQSRGWVVISVRRAQWYVWDEVFNSAQSLIGPLGQDTIEYSLWLNHVDRKVNATYPEDVFLATFVMPHAAQFCAVHMRTNQLQCILVSDFQICAAWGITNLPFYSPQFQSLAVRSWLKRKVL